MSQNLIADLEEFTKEMAKHSPNQQIASVPSFPSDDIVKLRMDLIMEEVTHELLPLMSCMRQSNLSQVTKQPDKTEKLAQIADGIADSIVVLIGTALAYGIPLQKVWDEVHRSNMDKVTKRCEKCLGYKGLSADIGKTNCDSCDGSGRIPITPNKRDDGKILKPEGWRSPNIKSIIEEAM